MSRAWGLELKSEMCIKTLERSDVILEKQTDLGMGFFLNFHWKKCGKEHGRIFCDRTLNDFHRIIV